MPDVNVGLGQASRLAEMASKQRLEFIVKGLSVVRDSARGFLDAARALKKRRR